MITIVIAFINLQRKLKCELTQVSPASVRSVYSLAFTHDIVEFQTSRYYSYALMGLSGRYFTSAE